MAFFVEVSKGQSSNNDENTVRIDISLIAVGKRIGMSFSEINELSSSDLLELARQFTGSKDNKPKQATQNDIDAFYGR